MHCNNNLKVSTTPVMDMKNVSDLFSSNYSENSGGFFWVDYAIVILLLGVSAAIGIYHGYFGNKQFTIVEYLSGGKEMSIFPISTSIVASFLSAVTLLGVPAEVLRYGATYLLSAISVIISSILSVYVFLPVFFKLQSTSVFEYLELRFDRRTRLFASFLYILNSVFFLPLVMYLPCLALATISNVPLNAIIPIACGICIFYTTIGGLKAVVWSDFLQLIVMTGAVACILGITIKPVGGFYNLWNKTVEGGRLDIFDFNPDPTKRDTFWMFAIGFSMYLIGYNGINQTFIQKLLALPTLNDAKKSVFYSAAWIIFIKTMCVAIGCSIYVLYGQCDPFKTKMLTRDDQLLPYLLKNIGYRIPGLQGIFIAGIFSASLSSFSSILNCLAATIYEDFIKMYLVDNKKASIILKSIVVVAGICCALLIYVVQHLGGAVTASISLLGIIFGPLLGLFTLGITIPKAKAKGTFYGGLLSLILVAAISIPAKYYQYTGLFSYPYKPTSTDGCYFHMNSSNSKFSANGNSTVFKQIDDRNINSPMFIFRISYYYYALIGFVINVIASLLISYIIKEKGKEVDPVLISPVVHYFLRNKRRYNINGVGANVDYSAVNTENILMTNFKIQSDIC